MTLPRRGKDVSLLIVSCNRALLILYICFIYHFVDFYVVNVIACTSKLKQLTDFDQEMYL